MAICKKCGTTYKPRVGALSCPNCASAGAGAGPEAKPSPPAGAEAADAAALVQRRLRARQRAAEEQRGAAPAGKVLAEAAGHAPSRAAQGAPRTAPERHERPARHEPHEHHERHERHHAPPGEQPILDPESRIGLFAALGFALIVGIVLFVVLRDKAAQRQAREAYEAAVTKIHRELSSLDLNDPVAAERLVKEATAEQATWQDHPLAAEIVTMMARARGNLDSARERAAALERFGGIETELKKGGLSTERLKELRRQLDESEVRLANEGAEMVARCGIARATLEQQYATRLVEEARTSARESSSTPRAGLVRYQAAEDELKTLLDRAYNAKNAELQAFLTPLYKQLLQESDALVTALFAKEGDSLAWIDCLVPPQASQWNPSQVSGFSHSTSGGVLQLVGPDKGAGRMAVISIGDREQWRHFQAEIEFVLEAGDIDLYFRLGKSPNQNTLFYPLHLSPGTTIASLKPGKVYTARISVIGSKYSVRFAGDTVDTQAPYEENVTWVMSRKGAIGLVVSPEARARFTKFRVRELR